jgi:hypothetical protein
MNRWGKYLMIGALGFALGCLPMTAQAVVDLNDDAETGVNFASEIDVDTTNGTTLTNAGDILDAQVEFGFGVSEGSSVYVRFDLSGGAKFTEDPNFSVGAATVVLSQGGAGESFAIFSVTPTAGHNIAQDEVGTLTVNDVDVFTDQAVTISYALYETAGQAVNQTDALVTESAPYINWKSALAFTVTPVTPDKIDVAQESKFFDGTTGDDTTIIGNVELAMSGALWTKGLPAVITDVVAAGTSLVVSGDFSAVGDTGEVYIDAVTHDCSINSGSLTVAEDFQSATYDAGASTFHVAICYTVDGETAIVPGSYTGLYDVTGAADSDVTDVNVGTLSTLEKNGTSKAVYNIPAGDGVTGDQAFVRITNTSSLAGKIYGRLYKQDGTLVGSATLSDSLAAHETLVLSGQDLVDLFGSWTPGRARLVVEGEIPSMEVLGLIRTPAGVLTNMSPTAPTAAE